MQLLVGRLEKQVIFLAVFFFDSHRRGADLAVAHIKCLHPVVWAVFLDNEQTCKPHWNMGVRLDMAMVIHRARLARFDHVSLGLPRHHVHLGGLSDTIVTFATMVHVRMVYAMQMNGMWEIMCVFKH